MHLLLNRYLPYANTCVNQTPVFTQSVVQKGAYYSEVAQSVVIKCIILLETNLVNRGFMQTLSINISISLELVLPISASEKTCLQTDLGRLGRGCEHGWCLDIVVRICKQRKSHGGINFAKSVTHIFRYLDIHCDK